MIVCKKYYKIQKGCMKKILILFSNSNIKQGNFNNEMKVTNKLEEVKTIHWIE